MCPCQNKTWYRSNAGGGGGGVIGIEWLTDGGIRNLKKVNNNYDNGCYYVIFYLNMTTIHFLSQQSSHKHQIKPNLSSLCEE